MPKHVCDSQTLVLSAHTAGFPVVLKYHLLAGDRYYTEAASSTVAAAISLGKTHGLFSHMSPLARKLQSLFGAANEQHVASTWPCLQLESMSELPDKSRHVCGACTALRGSSCH